jgi:hypothetical protein
MPRPIPIRRWRGGPLYTTTRRGTLYICDRCVLPCISGIKLVGERFWLCAACEAGRVRKTPQAQAGIANLRNQPAVR